MQRAKNYILKLMMENRQTKTRIISNCEMNRDGLLNENVDFLYAHFQSELNNRKP